jgi:hypothetical protein
MIFTSSVLRFSRVTPALQQDVMFVRCVASDDSPQRVGVILRGEEADWTTMDEALITRQCVWLCAGLSERKRARFHYQPWGVHHLESKWVFRADGLFGVVDSVLNAVHPTSVTSRPVTEIDSGPPHFGNGIDRL